MIFLNHPFFVPNFWWFWVISGILHESNIYIFRWGTFNFYLKNHISRCSRPGLRATFGPQGLFVQLISSWKGLLSIFWQIKRSKPKLFGRNQNHLLILQNQFGFAAKTFLFLSSLYFWGQISEILAKVSTDFVQQTCNYLVKMHVALNNFYPVHVAHTSKKVGQPGSSQLISNSNKRQRY